MKKAVYILMMVAGLVGAGLAQRVLNRDREALGLTRTAVLDNAPPVLAFTTVALGGFRGIIANILWIRANELQEEGKYFEMVQLADWITKLQPHFTQVWVNQAWNMAYNISVKFPDHHDRWLWVQRGLELLRDQGMKYNPHEVLMFRELAWFFQHKMGAYLDDAHMTYKYEWAMLMNAAFGGGRPNFDELENPQTPEARERSRLVRERYKMEPAIIREVDQTYGPLEWRLPESHAIYWATAGIKYAKLSDKPEAQLITLRRAIYQPMLTAFHRGRFYTNHIVIEGALRKQPSLGPNIAIIPNVSKAYETAMKEDPENKDHISTAHRNFIGDAVYILFANNKETEARRWFQYGREKYSTNAFSGKTTFEEYALYRIGEDINETSPDRVRAMLEGMIGQYYNNLATGDDDAAEGFERMARLVRNNFITRTTVNSSSRVRLPIPEIADLKRDILKQKLDPKEGLHPELRLQLRTRLGLPAEAPAAPPPAAPGGTQGAKPAVSPGG